MALDETYGQVIRELKGDPCPPPCKDGYTCDEKKGTCKKDKTDGSGQGSTSGK